MDSLKKQGIIEEILNSLYLIIRYCVSREYVKAHDKYLELAIGNAPWRNLIILIYCSNGSNDGWNS
jgi:hypothetical protein